MSESVCACVCYTGRGTAEGIKGGGGVGREGGREGWRRVRHLINNTNQIIQCSTVP